MAIAIYACIYTLTWDPGDADADNASGFLRTSSLKFSFDNSVVLEMLAIVIVHQLTSHFLYKLYSMLI